MPLLAPLAPLLVSWPKALDGAVLLLPRVASQLHGTGRSSAASLLLAYWAAMLCISLVVYLKMLFDVPFGRCVCPGAGSACDVWVAHKPYCQGEPGLGAPPVVMTPLLWRALWQASANWPWLGPG
jgi:hypothetical protein